MAKLFVVSDIHGYFYEFKESLDAAGFDKNNKNHWLVSCGDHFDRGWQPAEVMSYLSELPRKVLIRGNHEDLLEQCCHRQEALPHDLHNGTAMTIADLADPAGNIRDFSECCVRCRKLLQPFLDSMVNYYETKHYIFVHSWVPVRIDTNSTTGERCYIPLLDWRKATKKQWDQSRWLNPFNMAERGLQADKTIVCGHWHCSAGWAQEEGRSEHGANACFDPYHGDGFIAIDACTAHSHKVNILVLEDEFLQ